MGVLGNQPVRDRHNVSMYDLRCSVEEFKEISEESNVTVAEVIAIFSALIEQSKALSYVDNGDYGDENIAGIGDIFRQGFYELREAIDGLSDAIKQIEIK